MPRLASLLLTALVGVGLSGCLTPRVKPQPSRAVLDARAHRNAPTPAALCPDLASPVSVSFGFNESALGELDAAPLASIVRQLGCHPDAAALIVGQADLHGAAADQQKLAQARIQAVTNYLTAQGVDAARLGAQVQGTAPAGDARRLVVLAEGRRW